MMETTARQLDEVRSEMVHLLQEYPFASDGDREIIYERCELLGGEIQELVGLLKLTICQTTREANLESDDDEAYTQEIARLSTESLHAIHAAGEEVANAIAMLREARGEPDFPEEDNY